MNPDIKAEWLTALRSGKYTQGEGYLHRGTEFCCLGVLCDLGEKAGIVSSREHDLFEGVVMYDMTTSELPEEIMVWSGLADPLGEDVGEIEDTDAENTWLSLAEANDAGMSFRSIADVIEERL